VHTKEIQSDEDHMQYEENTMSVLSKNEREGAVDDRPYC